ncbi:MAG: hypothetical protein DRP64_18170 [Verrucomicrobia bacterium]|nr:MAG: hypothetical protein DRP64_18170 [Verrucomicrobiota bacterium]
MKLGLVGGRAKTRRQRFINWAVGFLLILTWYVPWTLLWGMRQDEGPLPSLLGAFSSGVGTVGLVWIHNLGVCAVLICARYAHYWWARIGAMAGVLVMLLGRILSDGMQIT